MLSIAVADQPVDWENCHTNPGRVQGIGSGPCNWPGVLTGEPRLRGKQSQVSTRADANHRVPRFLGQFAQTRAEPPQQEGKKDPSRHSGPAREQTSAHKEALAATRQAPGGHQGNPPGAPVFPQAPEGANAIGPERRSIRPDQSQ